MPRAVRLKSISRCRSGWHSLAEDEIQHSLKLGASSAPPDVMAPIAGRVADRKVERELQSAAHHRTGAFVIVDLAASGLSIGRLLRSSFEHSGSQPVKFRKSLSETPRKSSAQPAGRRNTGPRARAESQNGAGLRPCSFVHSGDALIEGPRTRCRAGDGPSKLDGDPSVRANKERLRKRDCARAARKDQARKSPTSPPPCLRANYRRPEYVLAQSLNFQAEGRGRSVI